MIRVFRSNVATVFQLNYTSPVDSKIFIYKDKDKVLKRYREIRKAERESKLSDGQHDGALRN